MNTFWLKIAVFAAIAVGIIVLINVFLPFVSERKPAVKEKTFYDVIEEDDKRLRAEPNLQKPVEPRQEQTAAKTEAAQATELSPQQFKELTPEEQIEAEKLFEMALFQRKEGRLPGMSYKLMVDYCRQIIKQYPGSVYAYKAKRMLGDIPAYKRQGYNITEEEINLSK
jgi:hypothetical protein